MTDRPNDDLSPAGPPRHPRRDDGGGGAGVTAATVRRLPRRDLTRSAARCAITIAASAALALTVAADLAAVATRPGLRAAAGAAVAGAAIGFAAAGLLSPRDDDEADRREWQRMIARAVADRDDALRARDHAVRRMRWMAVDSDPDAGLSRGEGTDL